MSLAVPRPATPAAASSFAAPPAAQGMPEDVHAPLTFIVPGSAPDGGKPSFLSAAATGGEPSWRFATEAHGVLIQDLRALAGPPSLDRQGFALRRHATAVADLYDDAAVAGPYTREVEALLKEATGADRVAVFDATRRSDAGEGAPNRDGARRPASRIHVDYTEASGPRRARDVLGAATVARLLAAGGRIAQVNVWRPIRGPVERSPLAVADAASVRAEDLVATDQVFPDRVGEIYHLAYRPSQRWYYAPRMTPDEVLLIKGWDSRDDGRARFTPHSAFEPPETSPGAAPRESIELRAFLAFGR